MPILVLPVSDSDDMWLPLGQIPKLLMEFCEHCVMDMILASLVHHMLQCQLVSADGALLLK